MRALVNCVNKQISLIFMLCCILSSVLADELKPLYELELPTQNEGKVLPQSELLEMGLQKLLIQLSATDTILKNVAVKEALKQTDKYVSQLSYHRLDTVEGTPPKQVIKILFNENKINQLLKATQKSIWQGQRPLILLWCKVDTAEGQYWLGDDQDLSLGKELAKHLNLRAMPYVFPLFDLNDMAQIQEKDILNENLEPFLQNAKRYNPGVVLVGHLSQKDNKWKGHWTLLQNEEKKSWDSYNQDISILLNETAEALSTKLSGQTGGSRGELSKASHPITIAVMGIINADQYSKVQAYLQALPFVKKVEVAELKPDKTFFHVYSTSDKESIVKAISEGRYLRENPSFGNEEQKYLSYRLSGE